MPSRVMRAGANPPMAAPSSLTASGGLGRSPVIAFKNVDFPAPLAPMMATVSPAASEASMP
jgi:hypothetical protein